jgi:prepilin-type N-terminal cleavage/methylation domain-containing protein
MKPPSLCAALNYTSKIYYNILMRLPSRQQRAFTLVEMLVVISTVALLTVIAAPALMGPTSSGQMNKNLLELSGLLEQARQYAIAQNTYVWVVFAPGTDSAGLKTLSVALVASNDGTDPASPSSWASHAYGAAPNTQIGLVSKIITLHQISLLKAGVFGATVMPSLPAVPSPVTATANSVAGMNSSGSGIGAFFNLQIPGTSTTLTFTEAVQFTSTGEVRNGSNPVDLVELDLQPQKGTGIDANNVAVIRVNGLTGESVIYRR